MPPLPVVPPLPALLPPLPALPLVPALEPPLPAPPFPALAPAVPVLPALPPPVDPPDPPGSVSVPHDAQAVNKVNATIRRVFRMSRTLSRPRAAIGLLGARCKLAS